MLDVNPYSSGKGPRRVYLGGLTYDLDSVFNRTLPESIAVWRSDTGGNTWMSPTIVETHTTTGSGTLDKPDLTTSWYPSTLGYVYVAYVKTKGLGSQNEIWVERSTDGGASFGGAVQLAAGTVQTPQVVVNSDNGRVYVLWVDHSVNQIKMAMSEPFNFASWAAQASLQGVGDFLSPGSQLDDFTIAPSASNCSVGVQAVTAPQARYNWVKRQIGVVWHERESSTSTRTDVFFSAFAAGSWSTPSRVNPQQTRDQWYPALDYDSTGDYLVVYYDRIADSTNTLYETRWARITSTGARTASGTVAGVFQSDPTEAYNDSSGSICFKGEYLDVWFWPYSDAQGPRFHSVWTGHTASQAFDNVYISAIK